MLAESMTGERQLLKIVEDDQWALEQKIDGHRCIVIAVDGKIRFQSRSGLDLALGRGRAAVEQSLAPLLGNGFVLDGEYLPKERTLWIFDIIQGGIVPDAPFMDRRAVLERLFEIVNFGEHVRLLPSHLITATKAELVKDIHDRGAEGVIARKLDAPYKAGRVKHLLKYKLTRTVDCVVAGVGVNGHDNLVLAMWNPDTESFVEVGHCTALNGDGKHTTFKVGDVVEVRCLYSSDDGRLVQPTFPIVRDKDPFECEVSQLDHIRPDKTVR